MPRQVKQNLGKSPQKPRKSAALPSDSLFNQLIEQAYELARYTQDMDLGGYEQRMQAKQMLDELERLMQIGNPWLLWQLLEASLIPKMTRLAKDINLYKSILSVPVSERRITHPSSSNRKYRHETPHKSSAYDKFESNTKTVDLNDQQRHDVETLLEKLKQQLADTTEVQEKK